MSARSAIDPAALHDDAFARDPFAVWERLRHEAPLFHDTIRMHQYHLTIPCLRVTLAQGGPR